VGDILSAQDSPNNSSFTIEYFKYTFEVTEDIKYNPHGAEVIIYSSTQSSSNGVNYSEFDQLYIFSYKVNGANMRGFCTNNMFVQNADKNFKRVVVQFLKPKQRSAWNDE